MNCSAAVDRRSKPIGAGDPRSTGAVCDSATLQGLKMDDFAAQSFAYLVLPQRETLGLTSDQAQALERIDLEYREQAVRLWSERELLGINSRRSGIGPRQGMGVSADMLSAQDALTTRLREASARARDKALAVLSADQISKLAPVGYRLPEFDLDSKADPADLDNRIGEAIAARIKDSKVVEIETTQAIAERLFAWAKTYAIALGTLIALLALVLSIIGISNWADFTRKVANAQSEIDDRLQAAKQSAAAFDQKMGQLQPLMSGLEQKTKTLQLQAADFEAKSAEVAREYAALTEKLGSVESIARNVQDLSKTVKIIQEQIKVDKSLSPQSQAELQHEIEDFRNYLQSIGYQPPDTVLNVQITPSDDANAYYDGEKLVIGQKLVDMPEVLYREYTQRVLKETKPAFWSSPDWKIGAIAGGLADYFPCSYLGSSIFGTRFVEVFASQLPKEWVARGYLRNLQNSRMFVGDSASSAEKEMHQAGEVWGGIYWDLRAIVGCKSDVARCGAADKVLLASWIALAADPAATVDVRFGETIVANVRETIGGNQADQLVEAFARRGLKLSRP